jgi:hypothetical protein
MLFVKTPPADIGIENSRQSAFKDKTVGSVQTRHSRQIPKTLYFYFPARARK